MLISTMENFKSAFARNYDLASRKFQEVIDEIDKSINHLEKTARLLTSSVKRHENESHSLCLVVTAEAIQRSAKNNLVLN